MKHDVRHPVRYTGRHIRYPSRYGRYGADIRYLRPRDKLRLLLIGCALLAVIALLFLGVSLWEDAYYTMSDSEGGLLNAWQLYHRTITVDGVKYRERSGLESYLLLGVDTTGEMTSGKGTDTAGQADVQILLVLDNKQQTWQLLQLNRDTMAEIPMLDMQGKQIKTFTAQLALAFAYGDGGESSCENAVAAVSGLLYDQRIDGYFAVNMDCVALLTDALGGVTVTIPDDYTDERPGWTPGAVVTLNGEDAELLVRRRYNIGDRTNLTRMQRQLAYLDGLREKLDQSDSGSVQTLYDTLEGKRLTDISVGTAGKIQNKLKSYTDLGVVTIDGENTVLDGSWAYYPDEDSLADVVLSLFFQKLH